MKRILSFIITTLSVFMLTAVCFTSLAVSAPKAVSTLNYTSTDSTVTLKWNNVKSTGYRVYKYNSSTKKYDAVTTTTKTTATVKNLKPGTKTIFAVKSYNKQDGKIAWAKTYKKITAATKPATVSSLKAESTAADITLTWSKAKGATGYRIYYYNSSTKTWDVLLKSTNQTAVKVAQLSPAQTYYFAVKSYYNSGEGIIWASEQKSIKTSTTPAKVKGVKISESMDGLRLTWTAVKGATGYNLYSYNTSTKKYTNIGATTTNSITLDDYKGNHLYYFTVRAYKTLNKKVYQGERSAFVKHRTYPTEAQAAYIYNGAYKAASTWLDFGGNYVDWKSVKTYNGNRYVKVTSKTINTKAKLRSYLCGFFTESLVDAALNTKVYGMDQCYRDFGGQLYKLEFIAGDAMPTYNLNKTNAYLVSMNGNNITFHVKTSYKFNGDKSYKTESSRTTFVRENNKWVVGTGDWSFKLYSPYTWDGKSPLK